MNYPNLESVDPIFKDYILSSLKERERIEKALIYSIEDIFIQSARRIISQLLQEHGVKSIKNEKEVAMKPLSATLNDFIDREAKIVNDELYSTIQQSIFSSVCTALSPMARIRLDYFLYQKSKGGSENDVPNKNITGNGLQDALPIGNLHDGRGESVDASHAPYIPIQKSVAGNNPPQDSPIGNLHDGTVDKQPSKAGNAEGDKEVGNGFIYILGIGYLNTYADEDEDDSHHRYRLIGEFKNPSYYLPKMKSIQKDIIAQADAIAKSSMQKVRHFREKEFKMSDRIWDVAEKNKDMMKRLIEGNVNKDVTKCAKAIDALVTKGKSKACREYPNMMRRLDGRIPGYVSFEAYRFARNEIAEITFRATLEDFKDNPFVAGVKWLLANNRLKQYEDKCCCNDLAYQDSFGLGHGVYPVDQVPDRPHVMCLCTIAPVSSRRLKKAIKDGMQLGNVPPKEWLESLAEEKDKHIKESDDYKIKHNPIELFNITNNSVQKQKEELLHEELEALERDFKKVDKSFLHMLNRCDNLPKITLNTQDKHYFDVKNNIISFQIEMGEVRGKSAGFETNMTMLLHEIGHYLDFNIMDKKGVTVHSSIPQLAEKLQNDALNFINRMYRQELGKQAVDFVNLSQQSLFQGLEYYQKMSKILGIPQLERLIANKLKDKAGLTSAVSDILEGLTLGKIAGQHLGTFGHITDGKSNYWQQQSNVTGEAVAHLFEASGSRGGREKVMQKVFPTTWESFVKFIRRF